MATMTPSASVSFSSEFNEFLYAPIGLEGNGMTLSVLSALSRLNIDPWQEAAQLSVLPKHTAAQRLAFLMARLPAGPWAQAGCQTIAVRLIECLPRRRSDAASTADARGAPRTGLSALIVAVALMAAVLLMVATGNPPWRAEHADVPVASPTSPPQNP